MKDKKQSTAKIKSDESQIEKEFVTKDQVYELLVNFEMAIFNKFEGILEKAKKQLKNKQISSSVTLIDTLLEEIKNDK